MRERSRYQLSGPLIKLSIRPTCIQDSSDCKFWLLAERQNVIYIELDSDKQQFGRKPSDDAFVAPRAHRRKLSSLVRGRAPIKKVRSKIRGPPAAEHCNDSPRKCYCRLCRRRWPLRYFDKGRPSHPTAPDDAR